MLKISDFFLNKKKENILSIGYLEIEHSQIVNLIGNNNSGKSLFFKTIHGDYFNFSGDIIIKEKPAVFYRKRKQTALVEVASNLLPNETVWANILLPFPKISSRIKMKISELCFLVGIDDILHEKVRNISFSQQKFVEIIRSVVQLPYLVMVDDIDMYFDEVNYAKAIEVLKFAVSSGSSVLLSSKKKLPYVDRTIKIQTSTVVEL